MMLSYLSDKCVGIPAWQKFLHLACDRSSTDETLQVETVRLSLVMEHFNFFFFFFFFFFCYEV